jgi:hypothetical protein
MKSKDIIERTKIITISVSSIDVVLYPSMNTCITGVRKHSEQMIDVKPCWVLLDRLLPEKR